MNFWYCTNLWNRLIEFYSNIYLLYLRVDTLTSHPGLVQFNLCKIYYLITILKVGPEGYHYSHEVYADLIL